MTTDVFCTITCQHDKLHLAAADARIRTLRQMRDSGLFEYFADDPSVAASGPEKELP